MEEIIYMICKRSINSKKPDSNEVLIKKYISIKI